MKPIPRMVLCGGSTPPLGAKTNLKNLRNMEYKKQESILENKTKNYDSKHILNLAPNKAIPEWVLDRLVSEGLTIEKIDELQSEGFPVCHYETQITIHGVMTSQLRSNRTANGYVTLVVNQNKSLGVRWIAVDEGKKKSMANLLCHYGWKHHSSSSADYYYITERCSDDELKRLLDVEKRIDKSLFYGWTEIYTTVVWGVRYIVVECHVNGIYERNMKKFVESMTGSQYDDVVKRHEDYVREETERQSRENAKYKAESEENLRKREQWKKENPFPEGFVEVSGYELRVGDITCELKEMSDRCFYSYKIVYKAGGRLCWKRCSPQGDTDGYKYERGVAIQMLERRKFMVRRKEQPKDNGHKAMLVGVRIEPYKDGIIVKGDTYKIRKTLKELGGHWNKFATGWMFPRNMRQKLEEQIAKHA